MIRFYIAVLFLVTFSFTAFSQNTGEITGKLLSEKAEPLAFATVTVYNAADTVLLDYVLSEDDGSF